MKKILLGLTIMAAWGCSQNKPSSDNFFRSPPVSSVASSSTNQDDAADDKHIRVEEVDRDPQWQDDRQRGAPLALQLEYINPDSSAEILRQKVEGTCLMTS